MSKEVKEITPEQLYAILKTLSQLREDFSSFKYDYLIDGGFTSTYLKAGIEIEINIRKYE